jgi:hypothetical protein
MLENVMKIPCRTCGTVQRRIVQDSSEAPRGPGPDLYLIVDLSRSTIACRRDFCARIQLGSDQKVNLRGTQPRSIPEEWQLIEFA